MVKSRKQHSRKYRSRKNQSRKQHSRKQHSRKYRRTMKGGSSCRNMSPAPIQSGGRRKRRGTRKHKKGGMMQGVVSAARTALLPFLMYKAQKRVQRKGLKM